MDKNVGRPRDDAAGPALLSAARRLVTERGYQRVSVQNLLDEAGVGRQTLYRRWPSKAELVLDAFLDSAGRIPVVTDGPIGDVLGRFLTHLFTNLLEDGAALRSLMASAQEDPKFLENFRERFLLPRARIVKSLLEQAVERGELAEDFDVDTASDMIHGAFWYRMLLGEALDASFAKKLAATTLKTPE
jgi:AcrR family transcriptional regulator